MASACCKLCGLRYNMDLSVGPCWSYALMRSRYCCTKSWHVSVPACIALWISAMEVSSKWKDRSGPQLATGTSKKANSSAVSLERINLFRLQKKWDQVPCFNASHNHF